MHKRGIALVSAIIMMALLLILLGGFVQVNRGHMWLLNSSEARQTAHEACQAGYEYAVFTLEHNRTWGNEDFTGKTEGAGTGLETEELAGTRTVRGHLTDADAWFEVTVTNNLASSTALGDIPKEGALLEIVGRSSSGATKTVTSLLHVSPLYDSTALTRGRIDMEVSRFNLRSKDPWRNQLRSEKAINVPQVVTGTQTRFLMPDSATKDGRGRLWSRGEIESANVTITAEDIPKANANSGGIFVPKAQRFEIFDLDASSVKLPGNAVTVEPGEYRFAKVPAIVTVNATYKQNPNPGPLESEGAVRVETRVLEDQMIDVLEHWPPGASGPDVVYRSESRVDDLDVPTSSSATVEGWTGTYEVGTQLTDSKVTDLTLPYTCEIKTQGDIVNLDDGGQVKADLLNQKVDVSSGTTVEIDGPFGITAKEPTKIPTLNIGTEGNRAAIVAKGNLNLQNANTDGVGTLVSKEASVNVRPKGSTFEVDATATNGLVLYAKQDIYLENPDRGTNWDFKGLAYAGGSFTFNGMGAKTTLEGSVVARNGNISFTGGGETDFIYNPAFLKFNLEDLPERRVPLERLWWRE